MGNFFAELKRRHIYRVAATYAVVAWLLIQLVNTLAPMLRLPDWAGTLVVVFLVVGFPVALIFAWIQQLPADPTIGRAPGGKADWLLAGGLVAVIAIFVYQQFGMSGTGTVQQASVASAPAPPGVITIAVLPLANLSGDAAQEFFSDGMTDEITSALARVANLRVVGRSSAFQFKGRNQDLREIGQSLGAAYLIDGSVRMADNRVRVTAQLIKADDGIGLWTDSYDRELIDVFAIEEDIAQAIAAALRAPLGLAQGERLISSRTSDVETYQEFLRARALVRSREVDDAIAALEKVVARDPAYAPGWALLSTAYRLVLDYSNAPSDGAVEGGRAFIQSSLDKAEMAARKAVELDPRDVGGYGALAYVQGTRGNWAVADDLFRQALALDPADPETLYRYSLVLGGEGRLKEALRVTEQLRTLEPFVPIYNIGSAQIALINGQDDATIRILEATPANTPSNYFRNARLARAYAGAGRFADAADTLLAIRGEIQTSRESIDAAARMIRTAPAVAQAPASLPGLPREVSFAYAYVGATERLMEPLDRGLQIGYVTNPWLWDSLFAPLRNTERFKAYVRANGLVDYWRARGWPDLCRPIGDADFECD